MRSRTTSPSQANKNAVRLIHRKHLCFPCSPKMRVPRMRIATKCLVSVSSALLVAFLCGDVQAQSGSRGGGYSAPAMSAPPAPSMMQSMPTQSSISQSVSPSYSAPMATGAGCVGGNCGGSSVSAMPVTSYSSAVSYPTTTGYPISTPAYSRYVPAYYAPVQYPAHRSYSAASTGCSTTPCSHHRIFRRW